MSPSLTKTTRFSLPNALFLAHAADLAYQPESKIKQIVQDSWYFPYARFFEQRDTQAFLASNDEHMVLSFRGTEKTSFEDWQTDGDVDLVKYNNGNVHRGFLKALTLVWSQIQEVMSDAQQPSQHRLWVTGHSLGGALATLAVDRFIGEGREVHGLYTFGQPRVGNEVFADHFDKKIKHRTFRFVNNEDVVTRLPPRLLGYRHVGSVKYFDNDGVLHGGIKWWRRFLNRLESIEKRSLERYHTLKNRFPGGFADHGIEQYLKLLDKAVRNAEIKNSTSFLNYVND